HAHRLHVDQLVDQHLAGGADIAGKAQAGTQQEGLAEGAAVGEFGEMQVDALHAGQRNSARVGVVGQDEHVRAFVLVILRCDEFQIHGHYATCFSVKRTALAAALNGSIPTRLNVVMKVSALPSTLWRCWRYVSRTASITSGTC